VVNEIGKVLDRLESQLVRITAVIQRTSAQERILAPAVATELNLSESSENSSEDSCLPVLWSSTESHRKVDAEVK
jgi:hypothetical protein